MQGCLSHGTSFGLQPKDRKRLCGILVFSSSWPLVGRVVWNGLSVNMARAANKEWVVLLGAVKLGGA